MRILFYSVAPWHKSGYGKVCYNICSRLKKHYEVDILGYTHFGTPIEYKGLMVYPALNFEDKFATAALKVWYEHLKPDIIFQFFDLWVLGGRLHTYGYPYIAYPPIDCIPVQAPMIEDLKHAVAIFAMTRFAQKQLKEIGLESCYVPHGVDTGIYKPMNQKECRRIFNLPEDAFIFGFVGTNFSERKNIPGLLRAFKKFIDSTKASPEEVKLLLWTYIHKDDLNPFGDELPAYFQQLGITKYICYPNELQYWVGLSEEQMSILYNCIDVYVTASSGEGFGLPVLEAMACGKPVIAPNFSSHPELIQEPELLARVAEYQARNRIMSFQAIVDTSDLAEKMKRLYEEPSLTRLYGQKMREKALEYDWETVINKYMLPALEESLKPEKTFYPPASN